MTVQNQLLKLVSEVNWQFNMVEIAKFNSPGVNALLIIDAWPSETIDNGLVKNVYEEMIQRMRNLINQLPTDFVIVVASHEGHTHKNLLDALPYWRWGRMESDDPRVFVSNCRDGNEIQIEQILDHLKRWNVDNVFYAGKSLPGCVVSRGVGLENLHGFNKSIIVDCVLKANSFEYTEIGTVYDSVWRAIKYADENNYGIAFSGQFNRDIITKLVESLYR